MMIEKLRQYLNKKYPHVAGEENQFSNHPNELWSKINIPQSTANLFTTVDVLENLNIGYSVVFGTLLGIYRDGELIEHDTDIDLAMWTPHRNKIIKLIRALENKQLMLTRFDCSILSFTREGDYIDLYMYRPLESDSNILDCGIPCLGTLTKKDFNNSNTITFHNRNLACVNDPEGYFQKLYGSDWKTPIKDKHANIQNGNR